MSKYLVVERESVRENIRQVKRRAGSASVYGVLKGNAYGFGMQDMADMLRDQGISRFAVTEPRDLIILRNSGFIDEEILVMRSTSLPDEIEKLVEYNAVATVGSLETARMMNQVAGNSASSLDVHVKINTGMGRYGFDPADMTGILSVFSQFENLRVCGMYTHFNMAYASPKAVRREFDAFRTVIDGVRSAGYDPGVCHCANSSALMKYPYTVLDAVRIGSAFTGRVPVKGSFGLKRTGYAEAEIIEINTLPRGATVGYSADYVCHRETRVAVVPIGYADGLCLQKACDMFRFRDAFYEGAHAAKLWLKGHRLCGTVNGVQVRVLGHVGMAHACVDVTDVDCAVGDAVRFEVNPLIAGIMLPKKYI